MEVCNRTALVDIISMAKHAAAEGQSLLTAAEHVEAAFAKVTAGREFTPAQQHWLDRIRQHLADNLTIGHEDFKEMPLFHGAGGWGNANRVFAGELKTFIAVLSTAMAA